MNGAGLSKKRAARIERRKAKLAAIFHINSAENEEDGMPNGTCIEGKVISSLTDEDYKNLRIQLKKRKMIESSKPEFRLGKAGASASTDLPKDKRVPIFAADLQSLILHSVVGDESVNHPFELFRFDKWFNLTSVSVLIVENIGVDEFEKNVDSFKLTHSIFQDKLEMCNPLIEESSLSLALGYIPLTISSLWKVTQACGSLDTGMKRGFIHNIECLTRKNKGTAAVKVEPPDENELPSTTPCSRVDLLLNAFQLIFEQYPVPGLPESESYLLTNEEYLPVSNQSPLFSLDCEWVSCSGGVFGLARVAVVDEHLKCVYHTLVKPDLPVIDYQTRFSGITAAMLEKVETHLRDVQRDLQKLLPPDAIVVGQSVGSDLHVLKLMHPYIIDTSIIYNLTGHRTAKTKLSMLSQLFLKKPIQTSRSGHDPVEDANAAMELVLLKLRMGKSYGDALLDEGNNRDVLDNPYASRRAFATLNRLLQDPQYTILPADERKYYPDCRLHQKLFTFLQWHNISSMLITQLDFFDHYNPSIRNMDPRWIERCKAARESGGDCWSAGEPVGPVRIVQAHNFRDAIQKAVDNCGQVKLAIVHTAVNAFMPMDRRKELSELDHKISSWFQTLPANSLMVVVFSGKKEPLQNGACLIGIRHAPLDSFNSLST